MGAKNVTMTTSWEISSSKNGRMSDSTKITIAMIVCHGNGRITVATVDFFKVELTQVVAL